MLEVVALSYFLSGLEPPLFVFVISVDGLISVFNYGTSMCRF